MRTFEEIKALLEEAESAAALSSEARAAAAGDESAAATARGKADQSAASAAEAHTQLVSAVAEVNAALAEIVAGDVGKPTQPEPAPSSRRPLMTPARR